jgi:hypothetical protein
MAKLINAARDMVKDAESSDKKVSYLFMAWFTEDGEITTAMSTNRLGTGEGWKNGYHEFIERAIETLQNNKMKQ